MSTPTNGFTPQTKKELLQQYIKTADDIILLNMLRMVDMRELLSLYIECVEDEDLTKFAEYIVYNTKE